MPRRAAARRGTRNQEQAMTEPFPQHPIYDQLVTEQRQRDQEDQQPEPDHETESPSA